MKKLFIASNNKHKLEEIRDILKRNGVEVEIYTPADFKFNSEPVEDGTTFEENAYINFSPTFLLSCIGSYERPYGVSKGFGKDFTVG